jgi:WD40 repeat protein
MEKTTVTRASPLLQELQQGRKMRSLNELMAKLDEDQRRHTVHTHSVQEGLSKILSAQMPAHAMEIQRPATAPEAAVGSHDQKGRLVSTLPSTPLNTTRSRVEEFREEVYQARHNYASAEDETKTNAKNSQPLGVPKDNSISLTAGTCKFDPPAEAPAPETEAITVALPDTKRESELQTPGDRKASLSAGTCKFDPPAEGDGNLPSADAEAAIPVTVPVTVSVPASNSLVPASPLATAMSVSAGTCKFPPPNEAGDAATTEAPKKEPPQKQGTLSLEPTPRMERRPSRVDLGGADDGFNIKVTNVGGSTGQVVVVKPDKMRATIHLQSLHGLDDKKVTMKLNTEQKPVGLLHKEEVLDLAYSKDGNSLVACDEEGNVVLWDVATQSKKMSHQMEGSPQSVAYAPDGQYVAAGGEDPYVVVWNTTTCEEQSRFAIDGKVLSLAFSPKSDLLAIGDNAKKVTLVSVPEMEAIAEFMFDGDVRSLSFNSESMLAGGGGTDRHHGLMTTKSKENGYVMKTVVWHVSKIGDDCKYLGSICFNDIVHAVAFSPSDRWLAVGSEDKTISLLSVKKEFEKVLELPCTAGVKCLAWSPDSRFIASGGEDMKISMWDLISRQMIFQLPKASDWYCAVAFHPSMRSFAASSFSNPNVMTYYVDVEETSVNVEDEDDEDDKGKTQEDDAAEDSPPASPQGAAGPMPTLTIGVETVAINIGSAQTTSTAEAEKKPAAAEPEKKEPTSAAPKSGGSLLPGKPQEEKQRTPSRVDLGTADEGFHVKVEAVGAGGELCVVLPGQETQMKPQVQDNKKVVVTDKALELPHDDEVAAFAYSPDGLHMISGGESQIATLWEVGTQTKKMEKKMSGPILAAAYSPNGQYVACGGQDSFVVLWNTATYAEEGAYGHEGHVLSLAFSPDSQMLAVGDTQKKVTLLSLPGMEEIAELRHDGDVRSLSFSPDGKMLAGGGGTDRHHGLMTNKSQDYQMKTVVWGVSTVGDDCKYLGSIVCKDIVHAVAFSPDGKWLAVGSEDRTIALLSVEKEFEKIIELGAAAGVLCLAWSNDSRFLASGGEDMKISIWDLQTRRMIFQLPKAQDWYRGVAFHPCMNAFATCAYSDSSVSIFPIEIQDSQELASPKLGKSPFGKSNSSGEDSKGLSTSRLKAAPKPPPVASSAEPVKVNDDETYEDEEFEPDPDADTDGAAPAPVIAINVGSS